MQEQQLKARTTPKPSPKDLAKQALLGSYARAGALTGRGRDSVVVLLYHRVSDAFRDNVTVGVEQFDIQMKYLAGTFEVMSLPALLASPPAAGSGPIVAITFDDGYLDNFENAAPILRNHGLPATFFVSTEMITHNKPFQHDLDALGFGLRNMSWDQIRQMQAEGFHFGAHTATHVNMARSSDEVAKAELESSLATIKRELNLDAVAFAYTFGKRSDFSPARLAQVKAAGYVCNCSAYGGINPLTLDRWDIRRQGVDYRFTRAALGARIRGWNAHVYV